MFLVAAGLALVAAWTLSCSATPPMVYTVGVVDDDPDSLDFLMLLPSSQGGEATTSAPPGDYCSQPIRTWSATPAAHIASEVMSVYATSTRDARRPTW